MRAILLVLLVVPLSGLTTSSAAPVPKAKTRPESKNDSVIFRLGGTDRTLDPKLEVEVKTMALNLALRSSIMSVSTKEAWSEALKGHHLRVHFITPRECIFKGDGIENFQVSELIIGFGPGGVYSRHGELYYAYGKYSGRDWVMLRQMLPKE